MISCAAEKLNDVVTHHMRRDFVSLRADRTVADALATIREAPVDGRVVYFYAVDEQNRLMGVVPTRRLLLSQPDARVADIIEKKVVAIPDSATVLDACQFFALHRLLGFPVVNGDHRILGIVDVDLNTGELSNLDGNGSDDLFQLIGVHASESAHAEPGYAFRKRFPWLLCNIVGGIIAAWIGGFFKHELTVLVELALFIPVVLNLAESVSTQSVSLAIEALHGSQPTLRGIARRLRNELTTAFLLGIAAGGARGLDGPRGLWQATVAMGAVGRDRRRDDLLGAGGRSDAESPAADAIRPARRRRTDRAGQRRRGDDPDLFQLGADAAEMRRAASSFHRDRRDSVSTRRARRSFRAPLISFTPIRPPSGAAARSCRMDSISLRTCDGSRTFRR